MKKLIIGIALFITAPAFAFYGKGFTLDGVNTNPEMNISQTAKVTILACGSGRMRSVRNYKAKCQVKQNRRGIARRKSAISQRDKARYRGSKVVVVEETLLQKVKRILDEKRAAKQ